MPRILLFTNPGFSGTVKEFTLNDPDLTQNGDDLAFASAIVLSGSWNLCDDVNLVGNTLTLAEAAGPNGDGAFKDPADWGGAGPFHVKSISW